MQLPQVPSVWEGDRRTLQEGNQGFDGEHVPSGDCILWVDGSEGMVRSMDIISSDSGPEAIVRTLIRAMENPRRPGNPARPQKIVVRNREIQFFLRGALQSLQISIDYVPDLPLIDELFRTFDTPAGSRPATLPAAYSDSLKRAALELWKVEPWDYLTDHEIISLSIENDQTPRNLYACIMGMLGEEYGVIFYRSLESLKQFRMAALEDGSPERLEQAFLSQDCWFLNYEALQLAGDDDDIGNLSAEKLTPIFGSIHPLEGIRPFLDEEEAIIIYYALEGLTRFVKQHHKKLSEDPVGDVKQRLGIPVLNSPGKSKDKVIVTLATMPDLSEELIAMMEDDDDDDDEEFIPALRDDLVPANAYFSVGMITLDVRNQLHQNPKTYVQSEDSVTIEAAEFPVLIIQTSRPKAQELISCIREEGGAASLGFVKGEDSWTDTDYDLAVLKTEEGVLHLLGQFLEDSPTHQMARGKWENRCKLTQGYCGLLVTMGVSGRSRGNPQLKDMLGFFEMPYVSPKELGVGILQLMPQLDLDW